MLWAGVSGRVAPALARVAGFRVAQAGLGMATCEKQGLGGTQRVRSTLSRGLEAVARAWEVRTGAPLIFFFEPRSRVTGLRHQQRCPRWGGGLLPCLPAAHPLLSPSPQEEDCSGEDVEKIRQTAKRLFTKLQEAEKRHQLEKKTFEVTTLRASRLGKSDFYFVLGFFWVCLFFFFFLEVPGAAGGVRLLLAEQRARCALLKPPGEGVQTPANCLPGCPDECEDTNSFPVKNRVKEKQQTGWKVVRPVPPSAPRRNFPTTAGLGAERAVPLRSGDGRGVPAARAVTESAVARRGAGLLRRCRAAAVVSLGAQPLRPWGCLLERGMS